MTKKTVAFLLLCSAGAVGIGAMTASRPSAEPRSGLQQPKPGKPVDRTTPILERMTPKQREHAQVHVRSGKTRFGNTRLLDEKLSKHMHVEYSGAFTARSAREVLESIWCGVDAAFTGHLVKKESLPTEDGKMLFTDHQVLVGEVIRSKFGVGFGALPVTVTRIGGEMKVEGVTVFVKHPEFPPLEVGRTYLFFTEFLPRYKTFHAEAMEHVWEIRLGRVYPLVFAPVSDADLVGDGLDLSEVIGWVRGTSCR